MSKKEIIKKILPYYEEFPEYTGIIKSDYLSSKEAYNQKMFSHHFRTFLLIWILGEYLDYYNEKHLRSLWEKFLTEPENLTQEQQKRLSSALKNLLAYSKENSESKTILLDILSWDFKNLTFHKVLEKIQKVIKEIDDRFLLSDEVN